jgi:hypothetical protein
VGCDIAADNFDRSFLNFANPITWIGNTGAFTLSSGNLVCSTTDRYIVASGMPDPVNGQTIHCVPTAVGSNETDILLNWRDTNNYDFCRVGNSTFSLYERIAGVNTLKATYAVGDSIINGTLMHFYRHGTEFAAWYFIFAASQGYYIHSGSMAPISSGITFGFRLHAGTLNIGEVDYDDYGSPCPEFIEECMACDLDITKTFQFEATITGGTGANAVLNGVWTLDFFTTTTVQFKNCRWRFAGGGTEALVDVWFESPASAKLRFTIGNTGGGGFAANYAVGSSLLACSDTTFGVATFTNPDSSTGHMTLKLLT